MTLKENEGQTGVQDIPEIWIAKMWKEKRRTYRWLICEKGKLGCSMCSKVGRLRVMKTQGLGISIEWSSSLIGFHGKTRSVQLASLRKKCHRHANSQAHITASNIEKTAKDDTAKYPHLHQHGRKMLSCFGTIYRCESALLYLTQIKNRLRFQVTDIRQKSQLILKSTMLKPNLTS